MVFLKEKICKISFYKTIANKITNQILDNQEYKYGFTTDIENIKAPKGLTEKTIRFISDFRDEIYAQNPSKWSAASDIPVVIIECG